MDRALALVDRTARALPRVSFAHGVLRLPLAGILLQNGLQKFPLSAGSAEGFGVPFALWILAALGQVAVAILLIAGGLYLALAGSGTASARSD